ncbi:MAK10-like protein [Tanacetum coccineum]
MEGKPIRDGSLSFLCVICFVTHSCQPPWETRILSVLLEITPDQATRAIGNTIKLPEGNNVVPLRSDTIRLVQNGCSFHGLRSEDPNQHLKDFLKLVDSLDLDDENKERTRLCLFQFSLRDQASNWLERLPAGSISTWEDLNTRFLAQFFPPGRTAKLRNDILIQPFDNSAGGIFGDLTPKKSWQILECTSALLVYNESWNDPRDFAKSVKAIRIWPSRIRARIAWKTLNKPSLNTHLRVPMKQEDARLFKFEADFKQQQSEMTNKIDTVLKAITDRIAGTLPSDMVKNPKLGTHPVSSARSYLISGPQYPS